MKGHSLPQQTECCDISLVRATYLYRQLNYYVELSDGSRGTVDFRSLVKNNPDFTALLDQDKANCYTVTRRGIHWESGAVAEVGWIRDHVALSARAPVTQYSPRTVSSRLSQGVTRGDLDAMTVLVTNQLRRQRILLTINAALMTVVGLVLCFIGLG
ncbi:DUF2442 domain-containing protein [Photobacterium sp. OFAV2-7]|uniref:DUF2442 domain-containing protein n=1 Tax=Photobacterium sp. OFAV2-7 TaxID=2917748 RepID=UPI001EF43C13|nr:DUF2442 domain-containing protein [Photobacterium sp. OFAV2-7]MCG7584925.1 DUF2442 domain-containing protein [Photobacterium sp. OFAV2-7]